MITRPPLLCTVRDCRSPLAQDAGRVICSKGHSFDIARSGYINLLQPQDRRSATPGDSAAATAARRKIHDSGVTQPLLSQIARLLNACSQDIVLDVGAGEGFYLASLARQFGFHAAGLDISIRAADAAARRYPFCSWIVANADRFVPFADGSLSKVLSLTSRLNGSEFHRVLNPAGRLLLALPAANDLIELRGHGHDRTGRVIQTLAGKFTLLDQSNATVTAPLDQATVEALLLAIYRPLHSRAVPAQPVTFSLDLLLFERA